MSNSIDSYSDAQLMKALLTHDFAEVGREFIDDVITNIKPGGFYKATNLDKVSLPALTTIQTHAFEEASIPTLDLLWSAITSIGGKAFYLGGECLPETLELTNVTAVGNSAFAGSSSKKNTKLVSISLPKWTGKETPDDTMFSPGTGGTFEYCSALASLSAPLLEKLPNYFCRYCTSLTELVLPKASTLGTSIVDGCSKLIKLDIGGAVTSITGRFIPSTSTGSSVLETVIFRGVTTVPTMSSDQLKNTRVSQGLAYIYVPSSLVATFKVATNWSTYADQIRAIEDYPDICG